MANYLSPGVYAEDVPPSSKPIAGVGTSIAGFLGVCYDVLMSGTNELEPGNSPVRLVNWRQFTEKFGDFQPGNRELAHAVYGFFNNGGTVCWVVRAVKAGEDSLYTASEAVEAAEAVWLKRQDEAAAFHFETELLAGFLVEAESDAGALKDKIGSSTAPACLIYEKERAVAESANAAAAADKTSRIAAIIAAAGAIETFGEMLNDINAQADRYSLIIGNSLETIKRSLNISVYPAIGDSLLSLADTPANLQTSAADAALNTALQRTYQAVNAVREIPELTEDTPDEDVDAAVGAIGGAVTLVNEAAGGVQNEVLVEVLKMVDLDANGDPLASPRALVAALGLLQTITAAMEQAVADGYTAFTVAKNAYQAVRDTMASANDYAVSDYLAALNTFRQIDEITIVAAPGITDVSVQENVLCHCEQMGDRFAVLDGQQLEAGEAYTPANISGGLRNAIDGAGAIYFPWIKVYDPVTGKTGTVPPSGHIAGVYARSDATRGVHKAPANEVLRGVLGTSHNLRRADQELLNPAGINLIRNFNGNFTVWGARTYADKAVDAEWIYISTRRLMNYIKESIEEGTRWAVFESNDARLWQKIKRNVAAFLTDVWRSGGLFGNSPEEAFYVKCDESLNPPSVRDLGQVIIEMGVAIVKPAEFVIFRISQWQPE